MKRKVNFFSNINFDINLFLQFMQKILKHSIEIKIAVLIITYSEKSSKNEKPKSIKLIYIKIVVISIDIIFDFIDFAPQE